MDLSPPVSSVHGILQARILKWVSMPSCRGSSPPRDWTQVSCCLLCCKWILYHWATGKPSLHVTEPTLLPCHFVFISFNTHRYPMGGGGLVAKSCPTLGNPMGYIACQAPLSMEFSRQNTRVCCHSLFRGIRPIQGSNLCLLLCRKILYCLSHQGSKRRNNWIIFTLTLLILIPRQFLRICQETIEFSF